jgi:bifunctional polynucleotide phosphatase/kinase
VELYNQGYDIVIFTNQKGLHQLDERYTGLSIEQRIDIVAGKIDDMAAQLGIPISAYLSFDDNLYRKPARGMFDLMLDAYYDQWPTPDPQGALLNMSASAYVGDAAGRPRGIGAGGRKDHADTDLAFAENVGLNFYTPEEFFLGYPRSHEHKWQRKYVFVGRIRHSQHPSICMVSPRLTIVFPTLTGATYPHNTSRPLPQPAARPPSQYRSSTST